MLAMQKRVFEDASEQEGALGGWCQRYAQISCGRYEGRIEQLALPGISITRERISVAVTQETMPPEDGLLFVTSLSRCAGWRVNSNAFATDVISVTRGGTSMVATGAAESDILMALIDPDLIVPEGDENSPPVQVLPLWAEAAETQAWLLALLNLYADGTRPSAELEAVLPDLVADRLGAIYSRVRRQGEEPSAAARSALAVFRRAVELAQEAAHEAAHEPVTTASLARLMDMPPETVREAFVAATGQGPADWLRHDRLAGARRDLLRARETGRTISDIAMQWGFWHLGRFSAYYARHFGEQPSRTLRDN